MDFRFTAEEQNLRHQVRTFLQAELPAGWTVRNDREGESEAEFRFSQQLGKRLAERGWLTLAWPKEYGGKALGPLAQLVYNEELAYAGAPLGFGFGPNLVGPTLMVWGTEEQKRQHLPAIARSEVFWCQGFSEPGAGSDLASLETSATAEGDDYVINGQKIWTSEGHHGDWMILLARTNRDAPKHRGISYFLLDMRTPGVSVQPLVNMMGGHAFNQVFFDNVRIPRANLVGEENRGWYVATTTLDFERSGINRVTWTRRQLEDLGHFLRSKGTLSNATRARLSDLVIELEIARLLCYRVAFLQGQGIVPNYESSMAKLYGSEVIYRFASAAVGMLGLSGQLDEGSAWVPLQARIERTYLASVSYSIAGGTSEIQRNVIATRGLGLPR